MIGTGASRKANSVRHAVTVDNVLKKGMGSRCLSDAFPVHRNLFSTPRSCMLPSKCWITPTPLVDETVGAKANSSTTDARSRSRWPGSPDGFSAVVPRRGEKLWVRNILAHWSLTFVFFNLH